MIRTLLVASAVVLGTVAAQAAGFDSIERQAGVYRGLTGSRPLAGATMHFEGRAATTTPSQDLPAWFYERNGESILAK